MRWSRCTEAYACGLLVCALGCAGPRSTEPAVLRQAAAGVRVPPADFGNLHVRCEPPDATVSLDGVPQGLCADFGPGRGLSVQSGPHTVDVEKEGYWPERRHVSTDGLQAWLEVVLQAKAPR